MKAHGIDKEVPSLEDFVGEALILEEPRKKKLAREKKEAELKTIAFPMIGTGAGGGDVHNVAKVMIGTAVEYLKQHPDSVIEKVVFMAWNRNDLEACTAALREIADLERVE